ncbi:extracellular solute-binding protein [Thalassospira mesophila]|nr:extracellular solute-binding protein [Thalassospira mesophila]
MNMSTGGVVRLGRMRRKTRMIGAWVAGCMALAWPMISQAEEAKPNITPAPTVAVSEEPLASLARPEYAISLYGDLKYGPEFTHFDYVNPDAPKGGTLLDSSTGSFDTLNPFILKGDAAIGLGLMYDTLLVQSMDEPFSEYGLVAQKVEVPQDRSYATFFINPAARFSDDTRITADDVIFSFNTLIEKGNPTYRQYYASVDHLEKLDDLTVKFVFKPGDNLELPLILGDIPVLPAHYWKDKDFSKTTFDIPVGSGPYMIKDFEPGRHITYVRNKNYWAKDVPSVKGMYNFDTIRYDYYRDLDVERQAFFAGEYYYRGEFSSREWATGYDKPPVRNGNIKKDLIPNHQPRGMQGFIMNARRPLFADHRVRRALQYAMDFQWLNRAMFYGAYQRTDSYFVNSELAATGLPHGEELDILNKFRDKLPPDLFTKPYSLPDYDQENGRRKALREAMTLLNDAGWELRDQKLVNKKTGEPFRFSLMLRQPGFEKIALMMQTRLRQLGIEMDFRLIDSGQWINRLQSYDFDMTSFWWQQSLSPGNEQRFYWSSAAADQPGSRNFAGIKDPVVDQIIDLVISASNRDSLVQRTRALDRVLLWGDYTIPQWYQPADRLAYWNIFGRPSVVPTKGNSMMTWWIDPDKSKKLGKGGY